LARRSNTHFKELVVNLGTGTGTTNIHKE